MTLTIDTFAWVEFLSAGRFGPRVLRHFEQSGHLLTPDVVLAEIARKSAKEGMSHPAIAGHLESVIALSSVAAITPTIALEVSRADSDLRRSAAQRRLGSPSFTDAIILATARVTGSKVLTGDRHFEGFPETEWLLA
ncbi:MAG: PIN domain-containing protein [Thermoplasmata archaeon]